MSLYVMLISSTGRNKVDVTGGDTAADVFNAREDRDDRRFVIKPSFRPDVFRITPSGNSCETRRPLFSLSDQSHVVDPMKRRRCFR